MTAFRGIFTPTITPILPDQTPDLESMRRVIEYQISGGVQGIWAMGTTSEFASFDQQERAALTRTIIESVSGRVPVIVNISDASTRLAVRHGQEAIAAGADAVAATPPYYYPHTQDEILAHYQLLRDALDAPLFIYNIPQTVRVKVEQGTARTLARQGTAIGIKDSQNDLEWFRSLTRYLAAEKLPFWPMVGTRQLIDAGVLSGAAGAVPSVANAFPDLCVAVYRAADEGRWDTAASIENRIIEIEDAASAISSGSRNAALIALQKAVLHEKGVIAFPGLTSPLYTPSPEESRLALRHVERVVGQPV